MKDERIPIYISFISTLIFLISTSYCYFKITAILTFERYEPMKISASDLLIEKDQEIAKSNITLSALYTNPIHKPYAFKIVMKPNFAYQKTKGVDGIKNHEFTYEILLDGKVVKKETEIFSYKANTQIELLKTKLKSSNKKHMYEIIFRLYSNKYDQSHLMGINLTSNISIVPIN